MSITYSTAAQPMPPISEPGAAAAVPGAVPGTALPGVIPGMVLPGMVLPGEVPGEVPVPGAALLPLFAQFLGHASLADTSAEAAGADSDPATQPDFADSAPGADTASSAQGECALPAMAMPLPNMAAMPVAPIAMNNTAWPSGAAGLERGADEVAATAGHLATSAVAPRSPADGAPGFDAGAAQAQAQAQATPKAGADSAALAARTPSLPAQAAGGARESAAGTPPSAVQSAALPVQSAALPVQPANGDIERSTSSGVERSIAMPSAWGLNAAPAAAAPAADTIRLAGQAPQWQQALKEALGNRLSVQLERNMEHAVIRIDPPMLGRIEISVRHTAGALQVNLSASNGEVLQQLRSIGESMRHDLAQRQYTEVSVNITATPRGSAAPSFADGGDGARGRHPGRDEKEDGPGRALSEAGQAFSTFALSGQE
jgi:flagellar hook-length control protein FliK